MKLLTTKKGITQKIIVAIVIVLCFNFVAPTVSSAGIGGLLLEPLTALITTIGDGILAALQNFLYNGGWSVIGMAGGAIRWYKYITIRSRPFCNSPIIGISRRTTIPRDDI